MNDTPIEEQRGELRLTTNREEIAIDDVLRLLHTTYWAAAVTREQLVIAMENSICFAVFRGEKLVGFTRIITDLATYAYVTDVVVDADERGAGIGKWMIQAFLHHPQLGGVRRFSLLTRDAQSLYEPFGFSTELGTLTYMEKKTATALV